MCASRRRILRDPCLSLRHGVIPPLAVCSQACAANISSPPGIIAPGHRVCGAVPDLQGLCRTLFAVRSDLRGGVHRPGDPLGDLIQRPLQLVADHHLHHHNDDIHTFVYETETPFDPQKLDRYIGSLTAVYGQDMLRYKGILYFAGVDRRVVFQGVHMLAVSDVMGPWGDVKPFSKLVFIGRNLPEEAIARGLDTCLAKA